MTKEFSPSEAKDFIINLIKSNQILEQRGEIGVTLNIAGEAGIGKTTVVRDATKELNYNLCKRNLANLNEPADLLGYNAKLFKVTKEEKEEWITEALLPSYISEGFTYTATTKTIQCPPEWVVDMKENTVLLLDDYNRSNPLILKAVMELKVIFGS